VLPALNDFPNRELATLTRLDPRTLQRIKTRAIARPHGRNRALLTIVTSELAAEQLEIWGITPPSDPLERIAYYLDHRTDHQTTTLCVCCGAELTGRRRSYCSDRCRKRAYRARRDSTAENTSRDTADSPTVTATLSTVGGIFARPPLNPSLGLRDRWARGRETA
jgi:hypothetical protein